ncbi:putative ACR, COG1399 [Marvinbryantia formatexigens DSM 14469]|uniref:ACR, COG1399 n=1 Tax=Marvinbryantia formatexigens DSM 14469 TaxID=478749 RepID=C6LCP7_9FIRM|nr:DUF177 domain-containing protein [Marvinbryantia formatexigens]EET61711.1 putative ACR, COG1399 [Marvinbryantia formatexigens DSM 14469]UWO24475.1 DUF177 domain-containing protein [Marvinbryantia formatexigens DSM 14469]SDF09569.1 uncharacterized protein SAMN05660368_00063 [Marvinbryantia formatexigens]
MLIDLNEVIKNDGRVMQTDVMPEMKQFVSKMGAFPIVMQQPVSLEIRNMGDRKLQITGSTVLTVRIPCDRCLEDVDVTLELSFEKEADLNKSEAESQQTLENFVYVEGYSLDVDKLVYSELLVNWPSKVLCKEDCKGICSICGTNLNQNTCNCRKEETDLRMAKIQEIFNKYKEV